MKPIKLNINYNSQRDNYEWGGRLRFWVQCWYTSSVMFLSAFIRNAISPEFEKGYVDSVETQVGEKGIGEAVIRKFKWLAKFVYKQGIRSGAFYLVHVEAIRIYLRVAGFKGEVVCERPGEWSKVSKALKNGSPVIVSTKLTSSGHICIIVGEDDANWIVHDPYGNARANPLNPLKGYRIDKNGSFRKYPKGWFGEYAGRRVSGDKDKPYIIYYNAKVGERVTIPPAKIKKIEAGQA